MATPTIRDQATGGDGRADASEIRWGDRGRTEPADRVRRPEAARLGDDRAAVPDPAQRHAQPRCPATARAPAAAPRRRAPASRPAPSSRRSGTVRPASSRSVAVRQTRASARAARSSRRGPRLRCPSAAGGTTSRTTGVTSSRSSAAARRPAAVATDRPGQQLVHVELEDLGAGPCEAPRPGDGLPRSGCRPPPARAAHRPQLGSGDRTVVPRPRRAILLRCSRRRT